jgi:hypothetical protein
MRIEPRLRFAAREAARWELPDPREAEVVVGVGMGLKRRENVAYAVELAGFSAAPWTPRETWYTPAGPRLIRRPTASWSKPALRESSS